MALKNYTSAVPVIGTENVSKTIQYFEQTLGFEQEFIYGDPPVYAGVKAGEGLVYICHDPALADAIRESVYHHHRANNAEIVEELSQRPWGVRQYVVRERNGYRLKVAESCD